MGKSWDAIRNTMSRRRSHDAATIRRMTTVRDHVNADMAIPLPKLPGEPDYEMLTPQLVADGIDHNAMLAAGVPAMIHVPALDESKPTGRRSKEWAAIRRTALYGAWHESNLQLQLYRTYRHLVGYGSTAMVVVPDFSRAAKNRGGARIETRDPLTAYPEIRAPEDIGAPVDVGFVFGRSPEWIVSRYPSARELLYGNSKSAEESLWDVVEWIDEDEIVIGILGPRSMYLQASSSTTPSDGRDDLAAGGMELRRWDNRAGMVPAVVPRRVTLDRISGQMERILPIAGWMGKLMALEVAAAEKGVFSDIVAIGDPNTQPSLVGGQWHDGRTGRINLLQNVRAIEQLHTGPSQQSTMILDRLERNARVSGGVSTLFGGESTGLGRTGRAIDSIGSFSVDPRIQEVQAIMAGSLQVVNRAVIAVEKGYWPNRTFSLYSGWPTDRGQVTYTPSKHFETDDNVVTYAMAGLDVSQLSVGVLQLTAAGLMSRATARDKHPWIEDPENEDRLVLEQQINEAIMASVGTRLVNGEMDIEDAVMFLDLLRAGVPESEAWRKTQQKAQERQAEQQQAMAQQPGAPEAQPGLGTVPPSVPPPAEGQQNLRQLVAAISAGQ